MNGRTAMALALILALPVAVAAQGEHEEMGEHETEMEHEMDMDRSHGMMQGGMSMMMGRPGPGTLLRVKDTLGLSEDQVERLEAMHEAAHEVMQRAHEAAEEARARAHEAMMGESADLDAFQAALEEAAQHDVQAMVAMARVHAQAGEVLTAEQAEMLHTLMEAMHEMHGSMGGMHGEGMGEGMQRREHQGMRSGG